MMIELDSSRIADEMLALTALRAQSAPDAAAEARRMLTADNSEGMRVVMRMVFAELLMELSSMVSRCEIDDDGGMEGKETRMAVEFRYDERLPQGMWLALKRQMEHAVAAGTLRWITTDADAELATLLGSQQRAAAEAIAQALAESYGETDDAPLVRRPVW